jgi:flagellar hook-length control protein FliK
LNLGALLDSLASSSVQAKPSGAPLGGEGDSFAQALGLENASFLSSTQVLIDEKGLALEGSQNLGVESSSSLKDVLVELGGALEELDDVALVALVQLIFALESSGPVGIRVESSGVKSAALPAPAEQFWGQLLQVLTQKSLPPMASADGSMVLPAEAQSEIRQWMQAWLGVTPKATDAVNDTIVSATDEVVSTEKSTPLPPQNSGEKKAPESTVDNLQKNSVPKNDNLGRQAPEVLVELGEASPEHEKTTKSVEVSVSSGVEESSESTTEPTLLRPSSESSSSSQASAVVVISDKADRLRGAVLKTLENRLLKTTPQLTQSSLKDLTGETWQKIKDWLKVAASTVVEKSEVISPNSGMKALEFLQFVAQRRQMGWETALSQEDAQEGTEKKITKSTRVATSELKLSAETTLPATVLQKAVIVKSYGLGLPLVVPHEVLIPEAAKIATTEESTVTRDASRESSEAPGAVRDVGVAKLSNSLAQPPLQAQRADEGLFQKFLDNTKAQLKMWVDRKLVAMQIQLEPVDLGRMQMKTVLEQGRIGVLFQVENAAAKGLLLQQAQQLKDVLEAQGLQIAGFYVEVWQGDRQAQQNAFSKTATGPEFDLNKLLDGDGSSDRDPTPPKRGLIDSVA